MKILAGWVAGLCVLVALTLAITGCGRGGDDSQADQPKAGSAAISSNCVTMAGNVFAGGRVYLRVNELVTNNPIHFAETRTNDAGVARFNQLPEGEYILFFTDEMKNPCRHRVDLRQYTGDNAGAVIGDCVF